MVAGEVGTFKHFSWPLHLPGTSSLPSSPQGSFTFSILAGWVGGAFVYLHPEVYFRILSSSVPNFAGYSATCFGLAPVFFLLVFFQSSFLTWHVRLQHFVLHHINFRWFSKQVIQQFLSKDGINDTLNYSK